jgi:DNA-binding SARP family transcriptional activator
MRTLQIHLFGNFRLCQDSLSQDTRVIPNVQALLALLLLQPGQMHSRDKIASLLWNDCSEDQARSCLNTALWRLRKILEPRGIPAGTYLLSLPSGEVGFNFKSDSWVDVLEFEDKVQLIIQGACKAASLEDIHTLEKVMGLYNQDLLEGFYFDWVLKERERLYLMHLDAMYFLLDFYRNQNEYPKAIRWGQQILLADPLREDVHRSLMRLYAENGQRALAIRQYQVCESVLNMELGIEPMPETRDVYEKIVGKQSKDASPGKNTALANTNLRQVRSAMEYIYRAQRDLQEVLARLDK